MNTKKYNTFANSYTDKNKFQILELDENIDQKWEDFINKSDDGTIYQHPLWVQILEKEYNQKATRLVCIDNDGNIAGILPFFETLGLPFGFGGILSGKRFSCLPRTPIAGPLTVNKHITGLLLKKMTELAGQKERVNLQIKSLNPDLNLMNEDISSVLWRKTYILKLNNNFNELKFGNTRNHRRIKWTINKAEREDIIIRNAESLKDLRLWYKLYLETMRKHLIPPRSFRFFKDMFQQLYPLKKFKLILAEKCENSSKEIIAGSILLQYNKTVFYAFNGSKSKFYSMRPNDFIQWYAIKEACQDGYSYYDLGEVDENQEGLAKFKKKWGAEPVQVYHYYFPKVNFEDSYSSWTILSNEKIKEIWKKVPLNFTSIFGNLVYRFL